MSARRGQRYVSPVGHVSPARRSRAASVAMVLALILLSSAVLPLFSDAGTGHAKSIAAAMQKFLLFYSGVFALIALTAAVGAGLLATDRLVMSPGHRVVTQAVHHALSLVALAALANHITLEIIAQRTQLIDAFVPFVAHRRMLYMGLGTLASDLFVVIIVTGLLRRRFATRPSWVWRGLHATAYVLWPMSIVHGLQAGRTAKPYVDWSYGGCLALVALALTIRYVATIRGRHMTAPPLPGPAPNSMHAAAMASGQFGVQAAPAWTGSLGPASPQRQAPRALTAAPEQPPWTQPRRGQDDQDIADYLSGLSTFPGSRGYGPGLPTFPAQDRT